MNRGHLVNQTAWSRHSSVIQEHADVVTRSTLEHLLRQISLEGGGSGQCMREIVVEQVPRSRCDALCSRLPEMLRCIEPWPMVGNLQLLTDKSLCTLNMYLVWIKMFVNTFISALESSPVHCLKSRPSGNRRMPGKAGTAERLANMRF